MGWLDGCAFEIPDDALAVQESTRSFAKKVLEPLAAKMDQDQIIPDLIIKDLTNLGLMGALIPEEYGGSQLSTVAYALAIEELAAVCASTAITVSAHNSLAAWPVVNFGNTKQKQNFLPKLASGKLGCFALSEPSTGSDAASQTTLCSRGNQDSWEINGAKNWITNAPLASVCVLFGTTNRNAGSKGVVSFVHDLDLSGITIGHKENKLGITASATSSIYYDRVMLNSDNLLGEFNNHVGNGFKIAMETLDGGRIGVAAQSVGIARASLSAALNYAKERKSFGKIIAEHQSIANYLAEMSVNLNAARYLTLGAAMLKDRKEPYTRQAAEAKLFASRVANSNANKALQIHGGYGYVKDYPVERYYRDAKITEIYEGTSEIQKLVIANRLLKEEP